MLRRRHAIAVLVALTTTTLLACEDDVKATPQAIFEGQLQLGATECKEVGELFNVGSFGNPNLEPPQPSAPIKDGEAFAQGNAAITCSVTPAGPDEFNVAASINLSGATGGLFTVSGKFKTTGDQTDVTAVFSKRTGGQYKQTGGCIVRYTNTQVMGVAAGRVWGEITCPNAENPGAQVSCQGVAQFRFENCSQ